MQQGGLQNYWSSVRDITFRQLDADGVVMPGTSLRVQLPGTALCSEILAAIRAAGQVLCHACLFVQAVLLMCL